jgi:hypothetical protein
LFDKVLGRLASWGNPATYPSRRNVADCAVNSQEDNMDADLLRRIKWECIELSHAFAHHLDHRNYRDIANLFAPDGVWIRHGARLVGPAAILGALEERPASQFTRHVTTGHFFTHVGETSAASIAYNMSYYSMDAAVLPAVYVPEQAMLLDFKDTYVRTPEGWRFALRDTALVMVSADARERLRQHA